MNERTTHPIDSLRRSPPDIPYVCLYVKPVEETIFRAPGLPCEDIHQPPCQLRPQVQVLVKTAQHTYSASNHSKETKKPDKADLLLSG